MHQAAPSPTPAAPPRARRASWRTHTQIIPRAARMHGNRKPGNWRDSLRLEFVRAHGKRALRRIAPVVGALAVMGTLASAAYYGATRSAHFTVKSIHVRGNRALKRDELLALAELTQPVNIFRADVRGAEARLGQSPWLVEATVRRRLPDTLEIRVTEQQPVAIVQLGAFYAINRDGIAFVRADLNALGELPFVTGLRRETYLSAPAATQARLRQVLATVAQWTNGQRPAVAEIVLREDDLALRLADNDMLVHLGELTTDAVLAQRLQNFDLAWAALSPSEKAGASVLRLNSHPDQITIALAKP